MNSNVAEQNVSRETSSNKVARKPKDAFCIVNEKYRNILSKQVQKENIDVTLINPRYITGIDSELMNELKADHELVITLEDGVLDGGFGEKISRYYGTSDMKVLNYGAKKEFVDRYDIQELLRANHLTDEQIVEDILSLIG